MKSAKLGTNTLDVEILNITSKGIWLYVRNREYFLSYESFPWFKDAKLSQIQDVELSRERYLHWRSLDVDLELESLKHLDQYPLKYR